MSVKRLRLPENAGTISLVLGEPIDDPNVTLPDPVMPPGGTFPDDLSDGDVPGEYPTELQSGWDDATGLYVDQRAPGTQLKLIPRGVDVHNVGFDGPAGAYNVSNANAMGGSMTIENVMVWGYDRDATGGGIHVAKSHTGTLEIVRCHGQGTGNNWIYASPPGKSDGGGGTATIRNCVGKNNTVSQFRVGPGSEIRDSVAIVENAPGDRLQRGHHPNGFDARFARGIWLRHGDCIVENCDIYVASYPRDLAPGPAIETWAGGNGRYDDSPGGITVRDTRLRGPDEYRDGGDVPDGVKLDGRIDTTFENVTGSPTVAFPEEVPRTPEEAAGVDVHEFGGYARPEPGAADWHRPINQNFEQIEADVQELKRRLDRLEGL